MDLYQSIADECGVHRTSVKAISFPFMYCVGKFSRESMVFAVETAIKAGLIEITEERLFRDTPFKYRNGKLIFHVNIRRRDDNPNVGRIVWPWYEEVEASPELQRHHEKWQIKHWGRIVE